MAALYSRAATLRPSSLAASRSLKPRTHSRRITSKQPTRCQAPPSGAAGAAYPVDEGWHPEPAAALPEPSREWQHEQLGAAPPVPSDPPTGSSEEQASASGGPLAAIRSACLAYDSAVKTNPVLTKAWTSFFGFVLGDRIAQGVSGEPYDVYRCLRLALYGLLLDGPVGHAWYRLLDRYVYPEDPTCNRSVLIKTALDQLVWGPIMTIIFFAFIKLLEGHPDMIVSTIQQRFWPTMIANYALWPLAHLINFKFVPSDWRILFNNVVAIFWTSYLSFSCGSGAAHGGHAGVESAATAASALLSTLPCHKVEGAMSMPGVAAAMRNVAALEHMLSHWGTQSIPSTDLLVSYLEMKASLMQSVCQQPIRLPPS